MIFSLFLEGNCRNFVIEVQCTGSFLEGVKCHSRWAKYIGKDNSDDSQ